jgi:hypothetical protein
MSELSKQALKVDNNQSFPNNNNGAITPSILRAFNVNMIDSLVDEIGYTADSASWNAQIDSLEAFTASAVTSAITASSLITASFDNGTRNLTFTKGNGTQFAVNIPDVSGSSFNTASFATTGSNTFVGEQRIYNNQVLRFTNNATISGDDGSRLSLDASTGMQFRNFSNNDMLFEQFGTASLTFNNYNGGIALTGSQTQIQGVNFIPFSASLDARILAITGSGGTINTGSFATTGSNSFNGNQDITGSLRVSSTITIGGAQFAPTIQDLDSGTPAGNTSLQINAGTSGSFSLRTLYGAGVGVANMEAYDTFPSYNTGGKVSAKSVGGVDITGYGGAINVTGSSLVMQGFTYPTADGTNGQVLTTNGNKVLTFTTVSGGSGSVINTGSFATTGSNFFVGIQSINEVPGTSVGEVYLLGRSGSLFIANNLSAAGGPSYASISHISSSQVNANTNLIFKDNSFTGSTIVSGSSNIFSNPTVAGAGRVNYIGGSSNFFLNGQSDQLPTITGSAATVSGNRPTMNGNYVAGNQAWTINQAPNPGLHTYSNNILANAGTWAFNLSGNTGQVQVNHNLSFGAMTLNSPSRSIAQINAGESGSMPLTLSQNVILGSLNYNGPVTASAGAIAHTFVGNTIAGVLSMNVQSQSKAISVQANNVSGQFIYNDNTVNAPTLGSAVSIQNNNVNGNFTITNRASASFQLNNNTLSTWILTNDYDASSVTSGTFRQALFNGNITFGVISNNIYFSGSSGTQARQMNNNLLGGMFISASTIASGSNGNMLATIGVGNGLNIVGTARRDDTSTGGAGQTIGSAFFGRYNKEGEGFNTTGNVILAVGTGTSGSAGIVRKTGFLIDSGSNSFFEGSLNVSGSTSLTGSLSIQSGSAFFANGNRQFNVGAFQSNVSQSGSANVSQSMNFEVTDISEGVSIVSNSRITLANSGTYNIQFSAQVDRVAGSGTDTVHIWLKKNGTNVSASAGAITVSGAAAAAKTISSWNYVVDASAGDYYEIVWQPTDANLELIAAAATGNIPSIPSIILTVTQVR